MSKQKKSSVRGAKKRNPLPILAGAVALIAIAAVLLPKASPKENPAGGGDALFESGNDVVVEAAQLGEEARYYRYDADGTTVELFAVKAPDGSFRLALNTCQVCNGSPYAYFVQEDDEFVCQNCRNRFSAAQVGLVGGGCNPVPITKENYVLENDAITVPFEFLEENAPRFKNWKQF